MTLADGRVLGASSSDEIGVRDVETINGSGPASISPADVIRDPFIKTRECGEEKKALWLNLRDNIVSFAHASGCDALRKTTGATVVFGFSKHALFECFNYTMAILESSSGDSICKARARDLYEIMLSCRREDNIRKAFEGKPVPW